MRKIGTVPIYPETLALGAKLFIPLRSFMETAAGLLWWKYA
jgi:hypothetical protein